MLLITPFFRTYFTVLAFVLGTVFASFLGCMGWRMCKGESVLKGRSHCDSCGHALGARDLIPILSYLLNKGRCRHCGAPISKINLIGEVTMGLLFALFTYANNGVFYLLLDLFFICILYLVTVTDLCDQMIPDGAIIVAILVKVVHSIFAWHFGWFGSVVYIEKPALLEVLGKLLVNGLSVSLPLLILTLLMEKLWKKEAMGGGDIKLIFVTGLYLGWAKNLLMILVACIVGIVVGSIQMRAATPTDETAEVSEETEEMEGNYFPFGPSIAIATVFCMIFGNMILNWYLSLF